MLRKLAEDILKKQHVDSRELLLSNKQAFITLLLIFEDAVVVETSGADCQVLLKTDDIRSVVLKT